jgi:hypothetical protein
VCVKGCARHPIAVRGHEASSGFRCVHRHHRCISNTVMAMHAGACGMLPDCRLHIAHGVLQRDRGRPSAALECAQRAWAALQLRGGGGGGGAGNILLGAAAARAAVRLQADRLGVLSLLTMVRYAGQHWLWGAQVRECMRCPLTALPSCWPGVACAFDDLCWTSEHHPTGQVQGRSAGISALYPNPQHKDYWFYLGYCEWSQLKLCERCTALL